MADLREHWNRVYREKSEDEFSWHQQNPNSSFSLIQRFAPGVGSRIIDVGAGTSRLPDLLVEAGYESLTLIDISEEALQQTRARLGIAGSSVRFVAADLLTLDYLGECDLWHDRALFHFLTEARDKARYAELAAHAIVHGGHLILETFAADGPGSCSGLPTGRYDPEKLAAEFDPRFTILESLRVEHSTPWGDIQPFTVVVMQRSN